MSLPPALERISDYAAWHATHRGREVALVDVDRRRTFDEVHRAVEALARALLTAGVGHGDRVATLQVPRSDYLIAFLATASIGAIWVGLNPKSKPEELARILTDCAPSVLLLRSRIHTMRLDEQIDAMRKACSPGCTFVVFEGDPALPDSVPMATFLAQGERVDDDVLQAARDGCGGRDPCLIVYTSGSTGVPKGALLHHAGIVATGLLHNELWPAEPNNELNFFPINHLGSVVDCSVPVFMSGGKLIFMEQFDARRALELIAEERVTVWFSVPSTFQMQLALPDFGAFDLSSVQLIFWGGAAMPMESIVRLSAIAPMATNYSMTESTSAITGVRPTRDLATLAYSVGSPVPGASVRLADEHGVPAPEGEAGEIQLLSNNTFVEYWRKPAETAQAFTADGWFRTGDQAIMLPDGSYRLVGRLREMYKSGGYNVYPREVEEVLEKHPAVVAVAIVPVSDPLWQEVGVVFITVTGDVSAEELIEYCSGKVAKYKVPKYIFIRSSLPLLPVGKIDKNALRRDAENLVNGVRED